jgi:hypothetical protein
MSLYTVTLERVLLGHVQIHVERSGITVLKPKITRQEMDAIKSLAFGRMYQARRLETRTPTILLVRDESHRASSCNIRFPTISQGKLALKDIHLAEVIHIDYDLVVRGNFDIIVDMVIREPQSSSYGVIVSICSSPGEILKFVRDEVFPDYFDYKSHGITEEELDTFIKNY